MRENRIYGVAALAVILVLFVLVNLIANLTLSGVKVDLTERHLFTLAKGTRATLAKLDEPVTFRLFYSVGLANRYPAVRSFGSRITDLLESFRQASGGKLRVEIVDPAPFSEAEDEAVAAGVRGSDTGGGERFYLGLVGSGPLGARQVIPAITGDREPLLEYDLAKLVVTLTAERKPKLGIISSLPMATGPGGPIMLAQGRSRPYAIYSQLRGSFDVAMLDDKFTEIPADIDVLMIADPNPMTAQQLYAVDQFVMAGKRAMVLVDPFAELASQMDPTTGEPAQFGAVESDLEPLLSRWGIKLEPGKIAADQDFATRINMPGGGNRDPLSYVVWLQLPKEGMNRDDAITGGLDEVLIASAGVLQPVEGRTTTIEPLIQTSTNAALLPVDVVRDARDPRSLITGFVSGGKKLTLAARITGPVASAFPDGPPKPDPQAPAAAAGTSAATEPGYGATARPPLAQSASPINIVVFADCDVMDERLWADVQDMGGQQVIRARADNGNLLLNTAENLAGADSLVDVRSRGEVGRPFLVIEDLQRAAEAKFLARQDALESQLNETEARLNTLSAGGTGANGAVVDAQSRAAIAEAQAQISATRKELRDVQRNLRQDIDDLERLLRMVNIALVPIAVAIAALIVAAWRRHRRTRRRIA